MEYGRSMMEDFRAAFEQVDALCIVMYRDALDSAVSRLITLGEDPKIVLEFRKLLPESCVNTLNRSKT
jgi:hypothetical protein